jgi:hypothetical protein
MIQAYAVVSKLFKQKYTRSMFITEIDEMNKALFERRIGAVFLSYVILVLNVKRGLGMFSTQRLKNPVSASDPMQGAAFHHILANFVLQGVINDNFRVYGVDDEVLMTLMDPTSSEDDESVYLESASKKFDIVKANLASFDTFTGRLKFDYAGSLAKHFTETPTEVTMQNEESTKKKTTPFEEEGNDDEGEDDEGSNQESDEGGDKEESGESDDEEESDEGGDKEESDVDDDNDDDDAVDK